MFIFFLAFFFFRLLFVFFGRICVRNNVKHFVLISVEVQHSL